MVTFWPASTFTTSSSSTAIVSFMSSPCRMEHSSDPLLISSPSLTSSEAMMPSHGATTIRFSRCALTSSSSLAAASRCRRRFSSVSVSGESSSLNSVSLRSTFCPTFTETDLIVPP